MYAPLINDIQRPFKYGGGEIKVYFKDNPGVYFDKDVMKYAIQIKDYNSSLVIQQNVYKSYGEDEDGKYVIFGIWKVNYGNNYTFPEKGQVYKIQIAYYPNEMTSYDQLTWSAAAAIQCIEAPEAQIVTEMQAEQTLFDPYGRLRLVYYPSSSSGLLYSYNFKLYDENQKLIFSTQTQLVTSDVLYYDTIWVCDAIRFHYYFSIEEETLYFLECEIVTTSGFKITTPQAELKFATPPKHEGNYEFNINSDLNGGYNNLTIKNLASSPSLMTIEKMVDNKWQIMFEYDIAIAPNETFIYKDYLIKQGEIDSYRLREESKSATTQDALSIPSLPFFEKSIVTEFEDMFLSDNEKQLKIKFDPQISSFKTTLLESKTDTIGGKYPFFFRNGNLGYKEFPISGLISYYMDEEQNFMSEEELGFDENSFKTINLTSDNVTAERKFRMAVLDWLNNGKPKLFRSPTEGTYIVRLMNVSLSPNTQLGRMLYSFSCTAYECAAADYKTMKELSLGG